MTSILAIETATNLCSVALMHQGEVQSVNRLAPREHAERVLGMIEGLLAHFSLSVNALDAICFGQGPGSFLGTRIAAGVAQGLGFAGDLPLLPVSSLSALAEKAYQELGLTEVIAAWDARLQAFYWGHYSLRNDVMRVNGNDALTNPQCWAMNLTSGMSLAGNAWRVYQNDFPAPFLSSIQQVDSKPLAFYPEAQYLLPQAVADLTAGRGVPAAEAGPVYLRDPV